jgi:hypothetical protein
MPDKSPEFYFRTDPRERLGFRVLRCHRSRNKTKNQWLQDAVREKVEREEQEIGPPPGPTPYKPPL